MLRHGFGLYTNTVTVMVDNSLNLFVCPTGDAAVNCISYVYKRNGTGSVIAPPLLNGSPLH